MDVHTKVIWILAIFNAMSATTSHQLYTENVRIKIHPKEVKRAIEVISKTCFGVDLSTQPWEPFQTLGLLRQQYAEYNPLEEDPDTRGPTLYLNCAGISKVFRIIPTCGECFGRYQSSGDCYDMQITAAECAVRDRLHLLCNCPKCVQDTSCHSKRTTQNPTTPKDGLTLNKSYIQQTTSSLTQKPCFCKQPRPETSHARSRDCETGAIKLLEGVPVEVALTLLGLGAVVGALLSIALCLCMPCLTRKIESFRKTLLGKPKQSRDKGKALPALPLPIPHPVPQAQTDPNYLQPSTLSGPRAPPRPHTMTTDTMNDAVYHSLNFPSRHAPPAPVQGDAPYQSNCMVVSVENTSVPDDLTYTLTGAGSGDTYSRHRFGVQGIQRETIPLKTFTGNENVIHAKEENSVVCSTRSKAVDECSITDDIYHSLISADESMRQEIMQMASRGSRGLDIANSRNANETSAKAHGNEINGSLVLNSIPPCTNISQKDNDGVDNYCRYNASTLGPQQESISRSPSGHHQTSEPDRQTGYTYNRQTSISESEKNKLDLEMLALDLDKHDYFILIPKTHLAEDNSSDTKDDMGSESRMTTVDDPIESVGTACDMHVNEVESNGDDTFVNVSDTPGDDICRGTPQRNKPEQLDSAECMGSLVDLK